MKSQQKIKREQGKFIGAFAVYGYRKSAEDKNKLCPDDYSADIVRNIFAWKLEGMSTSSIACRLNKLGVLSPMEYKKSLGKSLLKEEWIRVEGTHEAVISREDFETVQNLLMADIRAKAGEACSHIFSGILFCGAVKSQ